MRKNCCDKERGRRERRNEDFLMLWEEVGEEEVVVWNVPPYGTVVLQWHIVLVR